jgi:hypothetical protein
MDFLIWLFKYCNEEAYINFRFIKPEEKPASHFVSLHTLRSNYQAIIDEFKEKYPGRNFYYGVGTRSFNDGSDQGIVEIPGLWVDLDGAPLEPVKRSKWTYSAVIETSLGRFHVYWKFRTPVLVTEIDKVRDILKRLQDLFKADPQAAEPARVLRVPGTFNFNRDEFLVSEVYRNEDALVSLEDFDDLPQVSERPVSRPQSDRPVEVGLDGIPEPSMFQKSRRDNDLFHVANILVKGGAKYEEVFRVVHELGQICSPPATTPGADFIDIKAKVDSAFKREDRKEESIYRLVRDFVDGTTGSFLNDDIYRVLNITRPTEKQTIRKYLSDLHKLKVIEKYGVKNGSWRKRNTDFQEQDFLNAPRDEFDIKLPLELHDLVKLYPGNCILVSGDKGSGKTSIALITASLNMHSKQCIYLNVESDATELRNRLEHFGITNLRQQWGDKSKFIAREVSRNFADHIDETPNRIYLIDYLDCSEDYTQATSQVNKIHDALRGKQSVAIIGVQMNPRTGLPFGGQGLLNRPRVVVALEWREKAEKGWERIMTIKDAKTPRHPEDHPNGKFRRYTITDGGSQMRAIDEWEERKRK